MLDPPAERNIPANALMYEQFGADTCKGCQGNARLDAEGKRTCPDGSPQLLFTGGRHEMDHALRRPWRAGGSPAGGRIIGEVR